MGLTLDANTPWVISSTGQPPALEIATFKQTVILSWNQFVAAEGAEDEIRIAFASHDIVVKGAGLDALLRAIAAHRAVLIRESTRSQRFTGNPTCFIREIEVRKIEEN